MDSPEDNTPTLTTSTGKNDGTSAYGAGFSNISNFFTSLAGTAGSTFASLNQTKSEQAKAKTATAQLAAVQAQSSSTTKLLVIGGIVVAVIIVLVLVFKRK